MQSIAAEFARVYGSTVEIGLAKEDAAAKRAAAVREGNMAANMRAVMARHQANEQTAPIQPPSTDMGSVGDPNDIPLEDAPPGGDMAGAMAQMGGKKSPTLFGDTRHPGAADTAAMLRELGEAAINSGDYKTGRQFLMDATTAEKRAADIDTEHLEQQASMADMLGSIAGSVTDQASFTNAMMIASMHGMAEEASQLYQMTGGKYGPQAQEILGQFAQSSLSVKEQSQAQIAAAKLVNDNRRTESMIESRNVSMDKNRQAMGIARERLDLAKSNSAKKDNNTPKPGKSGPLRIGGLTQSERLALWKTQKLSKDEQTQFDAELVGEAPKKRGGVLGFGAKDEPESIKYQELKYKKKKQGQTFEQWHAEQFGVDTQGNPSSVEDTQPDKTSRPSVLEPPTKEDQAEDDESRKEAKKILKSDKPAKEETYGYSEGQIEATMKKFGKSRAEVLAALKAKAGK